MKNITKGVVYPNGSNKEPNTVSELMKKGFQKGYYVKSPAQNYVIRPEDTDKMTKFLKKAQSNKVKIQLAIDIRTESKELWRIIKVRAR